MSDPRRGEAPIWYPPPHVRTLLATVPRDCVEQAFALATRESHPDVDVRAATLLHADDWRALHDGLDYEALLVLVLDVAHLAVRSTAPSHGARPLGATDLAGWDATIILGSADEVLARCAASNLHPSSRLGHVVLAPGAEEQLAVALRGTAFRIPRAGGPIVAPGLSANASASLPLRTRLALRRVAATDSPEPTVKRLAALAGVTRRQLERQFAAAGLPAPAAYVRRAGRQGAMTMEGQEILSFRRHVEE